MFFCSLCRFMPRKLKWKSYIIFIISFHSKMNNIICLFWDHLAIKLLYFFSFFSFEMTKKICSSVYVIIKHDFTFPTLYCSMTWIVKTCEGWNVKNLTNGLVTNLPQNTKQLFNTLIDHEWIKFLPRFYFMS